MEFNNNDQFSKNGVGGMSEKRTMTSSGGAVWLKSDLSPKWNMNKEELSQTQF